MAETTREWALLFPNGRDIFYEGDSPRDFRTEIIEEYGFDPGEDPAWGVVIGDGPEAFTSYRFHCPAEHLDAIYGGQYPMGS